jgi:L,D-transpeptidase YcbB
MSRVTVIRRFLLPSLFAAQLLAGCDWGQSPEAPQATARKPEPTPSVEMEIQRRLEQGPELASPTAKEESELAPLRRRFYEDRRFTAAWSLEGWPLPSARAYLAALDRARSHGLDSWRYGPKEVLELLSHMGGGPAGPPEVADLDVLLTESLLRYAVHLSGGAARAEARALGWPVAPLRGDLLSVVESTPSGTEVDAKLESLAPEHPQYQALRRALAEYREIEAAGGWQEIPAEPPIERGTADPRISRLRNRLALSGDYPAKVAQKSPLRLDDPLVKALRRFQKRHGLSPTGRFGPETAAALNVPTAARIGQLIAGLERLRWFPRDPGERQILVNVPDFRLALIDHGVATLELRAIVGETDWPTPLLDAAVTQVILNPYWLIPRKIARKEIPREA